MNAQNVAPTSSKVQNAALISEIDTFAPSPAVSGTPLSAIPVRSDQPNAPHPIAASSILDTDYMRQVDPTYKGIKLDSEPSRIVQNSPENMNRLRRVLDRSETDPYTGKQVDYYRQLPPEENKDYRLPRETMNDVNRRFIAIQGYDHTKPKPQRSERMADAPQPDGKFDEAANYMRILNEMQERVSRDMVNNHKGERPAWMRETQRAFGYNGYQDMSRYVPDLPPTLRADTEPMKPSTDQVNNPDPNKELLVRGAYRDDAKTPHTGKVDWRNHAKSVDTDAQVFTKGVEQRVQDGTYRGDQEKEGFQPGPMSLTNGMPQFGEAHDSRRKELPNTNFALRATGNLTQVGATSDVMADRVLTKILDHVGRQNANNREFVAHAAHNVMYPQAMRLNSSTAGTDGSGTIRSEYSANTMITYATSRDSGVIMPPVLNMNMDDFPEVKRSSFPSHQFKTYSNATTNPSLPPLLLGSIDDQQAPKRLDFSEGQYRTYASAQSHDFNRVTNISRDTDKMDQNRSDQLDVLGLKLAQSDAQFSEPAWISTKSDQSAKRADDYGQDAGSRRNAAAIGELGSLQIGEQEILKVSGKRSGTGNISATQYLHGGGEGTSYRDTGGFNRESFVPDNYANRTQVQDFKALRQNASRTTQPM